VSSDTHGVRFVFRLNMADSIKRQHEDSDEEFVGPMPAAPVETSTKKRKVLEFEDLYLENLPNVEMYEQSFMHRDVITHVVITKTDFIITCSCDGHIKFWKKQEAGIEFVKHFRGHLGNIQDVSINVSGTLLCTLSNDKSLKVFDVVNFDMINMMKMPYVPGCCEWVHSPGDAVSMLAVSDSESGKIMLYDGNGTNTPIHTIEKMHAKPVNLIKYNAAYEAVISVDKQGILNYWTGEKHDYSFPKNVNFDSKLDTDLFEFVKQKTYPVSLCFSPKGDIFATYGADRKVRIFKFATGRLTRVIDESLPHYAMLQQDKQRALPNMEYNRRVAMEKELDKNDSLQFTKLVFDESGNFLLVPTMIGIKVINLVTNRLARLIGKPENMRFLQLALFQGKVKANTAAVTLEQEASENPALDNQLPDPTLFVTSSKKNRFYCFTRRDPDDSKISGIERDVFNEKPSKEDMISATDAIGAQRIYETAIIHTTVGDIHLQLFAKECSKTVENFCVHSKNGYYNNHIFHRAIKGFMIQTGDPLGTGTGGESIWGGEFADEFHPSLRHDRPYTLSMANAGANSNGSQFFLTVVPAPWLDNKHTVFGRAVKGMEVIQDISSTKTNPKTDKPYNDISIISITVK